MLLIVGLGNPGKEYEQTYHNMGFMALDVFLQKNGITLNKKKGNALIFEGQIFGKKVIIAKPQTYMNLSGTSLIKLSQSFKIQPEQILVIYDDIDLEQGAVRYRESGSGGTHNGMKNIVQEMNSTLIPRVRIGVGRDTNKSRDLADYVLSKVPNIKEFETAFLKASELIEEFILEDGKVVNKSVN